MAQTADPQEDTVTLPYPENEGQTHFDGCYCVPGHHNCAVHEVMRLQSTLLQVQGERDRIRQETLEEAAKVCEKLQMDWYKLQDGSIEPNAIDCAETIRALGEKP